MSQRLQEVRARQLRDLRACFHKIMARRLLAVVVVGMVAAVFSTFLEGPQTLFAIDTPLVVFVMAATIMLAVLPLPTWPRGSVPVEGGRFAGVPTGGPR